MKILVPGHRYVADNFEAKENGQTIQFIQKEPISEGSTEMTTVSDGTTNEEVLEVLLDRLNFLNKKFPCRENALAITHIEIARNFLFQRTRDREKRKVEGLHSA